MNWNPAKQEPAAVPLRINCIGLTQEQARRLELFCNTGKQFKPFFSVLPLKPADTDIYFISFSALGLLSLELKHYLAEAPVLSFGSPAHLHRALSLGCEDYLKEPWTIEELLARTHKALKHYSIDDRSFRGGFRFRQRSVYIKGVRVPLTSRELSLLRILIRSGGQTVPKKTLVRVIHAPESAASRAVDVQISNLRRKLNRFTGGTCTIKSERGRGYYFWHEKLDEGA